jgi:hypothetical protein
MKKKKYVWFLLGAAIIIGAAAAFAYGMKGGKVPEEEETAITAMYVPFGEGQYIFVGETAGVFTVTAEPGSYEVLDIEGNQIALDQLSKGNMVKIYGDNVMAQSYPGQYPGVHRMEVVEEGSPSDADQYQGIIDEIYTEPDPAEPPTMQVEYTTDLANATVLANRGGYEWVYTDKDGLSNAVVADSVHVLDWGDLLIDVTLTDPLDLTLSFSDKPTEVKVVRYDSALRGKAQEMPEGEEVPVVEKDGKFMLEGVDGDYVYEVTGVWENGRATYGFYTVQK